MSMIPLSQFPTRGKIVLTIKNSKGLEKVVKVNSSVTLSKHLSIIVDPDSRCDWYRLRTTKSGGIVFEQSTEGNIRIKISSDISLESSSTPAVDNYIKVIQRRKEKQQWTTVERFYTLEIS